MDPERAGPDDPRFPVGGFPAGASQTVHQIAFAFVRPGVFHLPGIPEFADPAVIMPVIRFPPFRPVAFLQTGDDHAARFPVINDQRDQFPLFVRRQFR